MPGTPAFPAAKVSLMFTALALAAAPVTFGSAAVWVLAGSRLISYWWLALTVGWAVVPLAVLIRAVRYQRRVHAAQFPESRAAGQASR